MPSAIRRGSINGSECADDELKCKTPTDRFRVTVLKNDNAAPKPVYVHVYGLPEGEELRIEREYRSGCDPMWSPMYCSGCPLVLAADSPDIMLVVPGTYRFSTASGEVLDDVDFFIEESPVHVEYAELWMKQQQLCCCRGSK